MTRPTARSAWRPSPILLVDCPLCDDPARVDAATGDLDCEPCGIRLELATDGIPADLELAA